MTKQQIRELTNDELVLEFKSIDSLIYDVDCFGVRDLMLWELLDRELSRRGIEVISLSESE